MLGDKKIKYENYKFLCADTETESLNIAYGKIWQIGWIVGNKFKNECEYNKFVYWPDLNVSQDAARITQFNEDHYKKSASDKEKVFKEFYEFLMDEDYYIVGHNFLGFDLPMIKMNFEKIGLDLEFKRVSERILDTLALGRAYKLEIKPPAKMNSEDLLCWQYKLLEIREGCSLSWLAKNLGVEMGDSYHDALFDVRVNSEVFRRLIKIVDI